ncbi:hypothetical protein CUMW_105260 [Citrus unshiu]|uniref:UspA domain-containing protein n=1 Tax=Citrus unshiu TaxID=55188 RepID=A0A2H5P599_CITUN|nr:hypothetical protein CUMW_105260 [Citrus unshiu]
MAEVIVAAEPAEGVGERKVMVAIDESELSHYALMWVLDNLKESISKFPLIIFMAQPPTKSKFVFTAPFGYARLYSSALTSKSRDGCGGMGSYNGHMKCSSESGCQST